MHTSKREIEINTCSRIDNALLLCGVPFAKGTLKPGEKIGLYHEDEPLPLWGEERSYWNDGTVKWIFLHALVPAGNCSLVLKCGAEREPYGRNGSDRMETALPGAFAMNVPFEKPSFDHTGVRVSEIELSIEDSHRWMFSTPEGSWRLIQDETITDLEIPIQQAGAAYDVVLLEESPLAPLIRIKPSGNRNGFLLDQLLRVDVAGRRLIWSRRMTWNREGDYQLKSAKGGLEISESCAATSKSSILVLEPGLVSFDGAVPVAGYPDGRTDMPNHSLWLEKAWQRYPFKIGRKGNRIDLDFYPGEARSLGVFGGTSHRHTIHLCCGEIAEKTAGHEVEFVIDPDHLCSSGALGTIKAAGRDEPGNFPGFEKAFQAALEAGRRTHLRFGAQDLNAPLQEEIRQHEAYFGLQHYGDWPMPLGGYGTRTRLLYADNEYDTGYAYYQGYAIFADWRYMEVGRRSALHMTDVDSLSTNGDMMFHGGGDDLGEDHELIRSDRVGEFGHYWSDGFWMLYFFSGDIWARESAERFTTFLVDYFEHLNEAGIARLWSYAERFLGWPVVTLMSSFEATGNSRILESIRPIVDYIDKYTEDPDREIETQKGDSERPIQWLVVALRDGTKPFMLGIVMEALERYHRATGDKKAADSIVRIARFIIEAMWLPHQAGFIYQHNALGRHHRTRVNQSLIPLFVRGLAYAHEISGDPGIREVAEKAFHASMWTFFDPDSGGKAIGQIGRSLGGYVALAEEWIARDEKAYIGSIKPSDGRLFTWTGGIIGLLNGGMIELVGGAPEYEEEALISEGPRFSFARFPGAAPEERVDWESIKSKSFIAARFSHAAETDRGELEFEVLLSAGSTVRFGPRGYLHLCDELHTRSAVSVVGSASSLHVRFHDPNRALIESADAETDWEEETWHTVHVAWRAPGEVILSLDGKVSDRRVLDRPVGGRFTRLDIGHVPGNWKVNGKIALKKIRLGQQYCH